MTDLAEIKSPQEYLPAEQMKEITISLTESKQLAQSLRVVNDESMNEANAACLKMRQRQKGIEAFRLAIVKPIKDHLATIDQFFKGLAFQFDDPFDKLNAKVIDYREKKIRAEREEREKAEAERKRKEDAERERLRKQEEEARAKGKEAEAERLRKAQENVKIETPAPKKEAPAKTSFQEGVGRTTFVKTSEHTIENLDLIPDEFWIVDEKKIGKRVRELNESLEVGKVYRDKIPGVVITCTERASYAGEK